MTSLLLLFILLSYFPVYGENETPCPVNCSCESTQNIECENLNSLPLIGDPSRRFVKELVVKLINKTSLDKGDLANFTALEQLDLTASSIETLSEGVFDDIRDTIVKITLANCNIKVLPANMFVDFPKLNKLDFRLNKISSVDNRTFVNLTSLTTLYLSYNSIANIENGAFSNVSELETLNLFKNHLTVAPFQALKDLQDLRLLTLSFNDIKTLSDEDSVNIPSLEDLELNSNPLVFPDIFPKMFSSLLHLNLAYTGNIGKFSLRTWENCRGLQTLHLAQVGTSHLSKGMFDGLDSLKSLFVTNTDELTSIGQDAFFGLKNVENLYLQYNKNLKNIDVGAFSSVKPKKVFFDHDGLTTLQETLLPWEDMENVNLENNPFDCDCNLKWMLNTTRFGNNTAMKSTFQSVNCSAPIQLKGRELITVNAKDMVCALTSDHVKRFATGIIVAVLCLLFFIIIFVIVKCRKRIMISVRRYYQYRRYNNDVIFTVDQDTSVAELEDGDLRPLKEMRLETVPL